MTTHTVPVTTVGQLFLARLLVPLGQRAGPSSLRRALYPLFKDRYRDSEWRQLCDETLGRLESEGLVSRAPLALTPAGRAAALEFLGIEDLPARLSWRGLKNRFLVPLALGVPPSDATTRAAIGKSDGLRVHIVQRKFNLPAPEQPTFAYLIDALVRKELGLDPKVKLTPTLLRLRILGKLLDLPANVSMAELKKQLPAHAIQAKNSNADQLRQTLLQQWVSDLTGSAPETNHEPTAPATVSSFPLTEFARRVQQLANGCTTGRFGDNKVFIAHVWEKYDHEASEPRLTLDEFKGHLCEANRQGLLVLSRADLPEFMDTADVQASETRYGNLASFHFIRTQG
jgi:hypothetical protein